MQSAIESYQPDPLRAFPPLGDGGDPLGRSSARPALSGSRGASLGSVSERIYLYSFAGIAEARQSDCT